MRASFSPRELQLFWEGEDTLRFKVRSRAAAPVTGTLVCGQNGVAALKLFGFPGHLCVAG